MLVYSMGLEPACVCASMHPSVCPHFLRSSGPVLIKLCVKHHWGLTALGFRADWLKNFHGNRKLLLTYNSKAKKNLLIKNHKAQSLNILCVAMFKKIPFINPAYHAPGVQIGHALGESLSAIGL